MDINQVITQAEGRRLEFKAELPMNSDLAKTVVAFANDAGGDILKSEGKLKGTYIRVGSNNRLADESILGELERRRRNISFDGEMVMEKELTELDITGFKKMFKEKTQEELDLQTLRKLDLVKTEQEREYPTRALVLFADDELRRSLFPYAKIECARFKGTTVDEFIDQKTIDCQLGLQAEEAYNFVLRHINKGAKVEGVYTIYRWEYPIKAIREIIRNAVVHRQYSLTGKDIKIAIYDDMVEITSPGLLPPSIDYSAMNSRQSDARNKVIAGVFKHLGIIDQWGNGLKMVAEEMKQYPHIELKWREGGLSFQVQFVNKAFGGDVGDLGGDGGDLGGDGGDLGGDLETDNEPKIKEVLDIILENDKITVRDLADKAHVSKRNCERIIADLKERGILEREGNTRTGRWIIRQA